MQFTIQFELFEAGGCIEHRKVNTIRYPQELKKDGFSAPEMILDTSHGSITDLTEPFLQLLFTSIKADLEHKLSDFSDKLPHNSRRDISITAKCSIEVTPV